MQTTRTMIALLAAAGMVTAAGSLAYAQKSQPTVQAPVQQAIAQQQRQQRQQRRDLRALEEGGNAARNSEASVVGCLLHAIHLYCASARVAACGCSTTVSPAATPVSSSTWPPSTRPKRTWRSSGLPPAPWT